MSGLIWIMCAKCSGTGKKDNQFFVDTFGFPKKRKTPALEKECKVCRGKGKIQMVETKKPDNPIK